MSPFGLTDATSTSGCSVQGSGRDGGPAVSVRVHPAGPAAPSKGRSKRASTPFGRSSTCRGRSPTPCSPPPTKRRVVGPGATTSIARRGRSAPSTRPGRPISTRRSSSTPLPERGRGPRAALRHRRRRLLRRPRRGDRPGGVGAGRDDLPARPALDALPTGAVRGGGQPAPGRTTAGRGVHGPRRRRRHGAPRRRRARRRAQSRPARLRRPSRRLRSRGSPSSPGASCWPRIDGARRGWSSRSRR